MEELKLFCSALSKQMESQLLGVRMEFPRADEWSKESVLIIHSYLKQLKSYILEHPFKKRSEEVFFFKEVKCAVMGRLLYHVWVYNIESDRPLDYLNVSASIEFLSNELDEVHSFYEKHSELYDYFKNNLTIADNKFFLREVDDLFTFKDMPQFVDSAFYYGDPEFSTPFDYLFAQFRGYNLLEDYLTSEIETLELMGNEIPEEKLHFSGSNADFVQMVEMFQKMVNPMNNETGEPLSEQEVADMLADMFDFDWGDAEDFETLKLIAGDSTFTEEMQDTLKRLRAKWNEEDGDKEYGEEN